MESKGQPPRLSPSPVPLCLLVSAYEPFVPSAVPLDSTLTFLGPRAARPASRLFQGPRALRFFYIYTAGIARGVLTLRSTTLPHNYVST